ncbi:MAG TPA: hypothetical protein VNN79_17915 [Actinomycetota bacterium]|nr:hypothetical protein [Actinomycetota bacterium]
MNILRRFLYLSAALNALVGLALATVPKVVTKSVFAQAPYTEYAWVRIGGIQAFALAMLQVLVAQRAADVWWWSWAFVLVEGLVAVVAALNAIFGLAPGSSSILWWLIAVVNGVLTAGLLWGIGRTGQERPLP